MNSDSRRVVWITGASSGIGEALAEVFALHGDRVIVSARSEGKLENLRQKISQSGGSCDVVVCDLQNPESIHRAVETVKNACRTIDVLINNAGVSSFKDFAATDLQDFDRVISTNLRGPFLLTQSVLPWFLEKHQGLIMNILSFVTKEIFTQSSIYSASKAGLGAMMDVLRAEVRRQGVHVVNVYPGAVRTSIWHPKVLEKYQSHMMDPFEVASMILQVSLQPPSLMVEELVLRPQGGNLNV